MKDAVFDVATYLGATKTELEEMGTEGTEYVALVDGMGEDKSSPLHTIA